jgi:hypothetical protein
MCNTQCALRIAQQEEENDMGNERNNGVKVAEEEPSALRVAEERTPRTTIGIKAEISLPMDSVLQSAKARYAAGKVEVFVHFDVDRTVEETEDENGETAYALRAGFAPKARAATQLVYNGVVVPLVNYVTEDLADNVARVLRIPIAEPLKGEES